MKLLKQLSFLAVASVIFFSSCLSDDSTNFDPNVQFETDLELIEQYKLDNNLTDMIVENGISYRIDSVGPGISPTLSDNIVVKYKGHLLNGNEFDANATGIEFPLSGLIPGWQFGIPKLKDFGGSGTFIIPSAFAYGNRSQGSIPANSVLVFEIILEETVKSVDPVAQLEVDLALIEEYKVDNNLTGMSIEDNISFRIDSVGTGESPILTDNVVVKYKGYTLAGDVFDENTEGENILLSEAIEGWQLAIQDLKGMGGSGTFIMPSGLAYKNRRQGSLGQNAVVIFEITLEEVVK